MTEQLKKEMEKDYPLIRMADITDEARILAVAWHENATNWIGDKHKLASDIMNYARRQSAKEKQKADKLAEALEIIAHPVNYLQKQAEKDGGILNGIAALQFAKDGHWLSDIAKKALRDYEGEKSNPTN